MSWWTEEDQTEALKYGWKLVALDSTSGALLDTQGGAEYDRFWDTPDDAMCKLKVLWALDNPTCIDEGEAQMLRKRKP